MTTVYSFHSMEAYKHENTACHEGRVLERWKLEVSNPCSTIPLCFNLKFYQSSKQTGRYSCYTEDFSVSSLLDASLLYPLQKWCWSSQRDISLSPARCDCTAISSLYITSSFLGCPGKVQYTNFFSSFSSQCVKMHTF